MVRGVYEREGGAFNGDTHMIEAGENATFALVYKRHGFVIPPLTYKLDGEETAGAPPASFVHGPKIATPEDADKVVLHLVDSIWGSQCKIQATYQSGPKLSSQKSGYIFNHFFHHAPNHVP